MSGSSRTGVHRAHRCAATGWGFSWPVRPAPGNPPHEFIWGEHPLAWRHLDADEFKLRLLAAADADGSLQQLLPEEFRAAPGQPSRFYPNELSALVHIESNLLLETAVALVVGGGERDHRRHNGLEAVGDRAGVPPRARALHNPHRRRRSLREIATARIVHRWQQGFTAALHASKDDPAARMGGRWLPNSAVDRLFTENRLPDGKPLHGRSVSELNGREVSEESPAVTRYDLYHTLAVDRGPQHIERRERAAVGQWERTWGETDTQDRECADRIPEPEIDNR
ncbi:hypothetical protein ACH47B_25430 [Rhodococcus sp. NPDC019627]|uniref:hypothetical protein n=1 Tax=unclassified Rhodococcus (in: high G+C Gram-positive bacteria) TaxID=192944 RepID=UPI0033E67E68